MNYAEKSLNNSLDILVPFYKEAGLFSNALGGLKNMVRAADNVAAASTGEIAETTGKTLSKSQAKKQVKGAFARAQKKNPDLKFNEFSQKTTGTLADPQYKEFLNSQKDRAGQVYRPSNEAPDLSDLKPTADPNDLNMSYPQMDKVKRTVTTPPPATRTPSPGQQQMAENNPLAPKGDNSTPAATKPQKNLTPKQQERAAYQKAVKEQPGLKFKDFVNRGDPNDLNMGYGKAPDVNVPNEVPLATLKASPSGLPVSQKSKGIIRNVKGGNTPTRTNSRTRNKKVEPTKTDAPIGSAPEVKATVPEVTTPKTEAVPPKTEIETSVATNKTPDPEIPPKSEVPPTEPPPNNSGSKKTEPPKGETPKNSDSFIKKN